jgi:hypothetical protein
MLPNCLQCAGRRLNVVAFCTSVKRQSHFLAVLLWLIAQKYAGNLFDAMG